MLHGLGGCEVLGFVRLLLAIQTLKNWQLETGKRPLSSAHVVWPEMFRSVGSRGRSRVSGARGGGGARAGYR